MSEQKRRGGRRKGSPAVKAVYDAALVGDNDLNAPLEAESWDYSGCVERKLTGPFSRGRETVIITPKGVDMVRQLRSMHYNIKLIAYLLGIGGSTLKDAAKRQPEVAEALEAGTAISEAKLVHITLRAANNGFAPAAMFLLKTMHGYRENDTPQTNVSNVTIQLPASMTLEQMRQLKSEGLAINQLPMPHFDDVDDEAIETEGVPVGKDDTSH